MEIVEGLSFGLGSLLHFIFLMYKMLQFVLRCVFNGKRKIIIKKSDYVVISVFINLFSNSKGDNPFRRRAYNYFCADWDGLWGHLRGIPWENIFKLVASAAATEFCD